MRDITNDEGNRLLRIVRRSSGSVATWRRAQMVLFSAQAMKVAMIAKVTFTSQNRVRDVLHNFINLDGFDSLDRRYGGGRPPTFTLDPCFEVKKNRILNLYGLMDGTDHASHPSREALSAAISPGGTVPITAGSAKLSTGRRLPDAPLVTPVPDMLPRSSVWG